MIQIKTIFKGLVLAVFLLFVSCEGHYDKTRKVPGDDTSFDPVLNFPTIEKWANMYHNDKIVFYRINAYFVKPDGTLDIQTESYDARVLYVFVHEKPELSETVETPIGASPSYIYNKGPNVTNIKVSRPWKIESRDDENTVTITTMNKGMVRYPDDTRPGYASALLKVFDTFPREEPLVSFADLWKKAIEAGAPGENAVAQITFTQLQGYSFYIPGTEFYFNFDLEGNIL